MVGEASALEQIPYGIEQVRRSSFRKDTPAVKEMLKTDEINGSIFWDELLQGAYDYNNGLIGSPTLICVGKDGRRTNYFSWLKKPDFDLEKVEVRNFIKFDENGKPIGLKPDHVATMAHMGGEGTFGRHGVGLSAASTACLVAGLVEGITYESSDNLGAWKGQGEMIKESPDAEAKTLHLKYTRTSTDFGKETVITVEKPTQKLVQTLINLSKNSLSASPYYEFALLGGHEEEVKIPNVLTVFANGGAAEGQRRAFFTDEECEEKFGLKNLKTQKPTSRPRVEILPGTLLREEGVTTTRVHCGGVNLDGNNDYALNWSFYGFDHASVRYRVTRSNDSTSMVGDPRSLMAEVLRKCTYSEVFSQIFEASTQSSCMEGQIPQDLFTDLPKEVETAIAQGWKDFLRAHGYEGQKLVVSSGYRSEQRAQAAGIDSVRINSETFTSVLVSMGLVMSADERIAIKEREAKANRVNISTSDEAVNIVSHMKSELGAGRTLLFLDTETCGITIDFKTASTRGDIEDFAKDLEVANFEAYTLVRYFMALSKGQIPIVVTVKRADGYFDYAFDFSKEQTKNGTQEFFKVKKTQATEGIASGVRMRLIPPSPLPERYKEVFYSLVEEYGDFLDSNGMLRVEEYSASQSMGLSFLNARMEEVRRELAEERTQLLKIAQMVKDAMDDPRKVLRHEMETEPDGVFEEELAAILNSEGTQDSETEGDSFAYLASDLGDAVKTEPPEQETSEKKQLSPDISVEYGGGIAPERDFLIGYDMYPYSNETLNDYEKVENFQRGKQQRKVTVMYDKPIPTGKHIIYVRNGMTPVGIFTPGDEQVDVYRLQDRNMWAISSDVPIEKGMEVYFENTGFVDTSYPSKREMTPLVNIDDLAPYWRNLVLALKDDKSLNALQKNDIIGYAWHKAFTYDSNARFPKGSNFAYFINNPRGDCGWTTRAFVALSRAVGNPARIVAAQMVKNGQVITGEDSHALAKVYINGEWLTYEPQWSNGYVDRDLLLDPIPQKYLDIIKEIPQGEVLEGEILNSGETGLPFAPRIIPQKQDRIIRESRARTNRRKMEEEMRMREKVERELDLEIDKRMKNIPTE